MDGSCSDFNNYSGSGSYLPKKIRIRPVPDLLHYMKEQNFGECETALSRLFHGLRRNFRFISKQEEREQEFYKQLSCMVYAH